KLRGPAAEVGRDGSADRRVLSHLSAAGSHGPARRRGGSPRRHAVHRDDHEPGAAGLLRLPRRPAEAKPRPPASPARAIPRHGRAPLVRPPPMADAPILPLDRARACAHIIDRRWRQYQPLITVRVSLLVTRAFAAIARYPRGRGRPG